MIFDPAFKRVQRLFKIRHLFPIVHLSRVEWQVLVPMLMSLIAWLPANTFIRTSVWAPFTDKTCNCI